MSKTYHLTKSIFSLFIFSFLLCFSISALAQEQEQDTTKTDQETGFKPYSEVITDKAESDVGLFTVHKVQDAYYFEIPDSLLGRDMLITSRRAAMSSSEMDDMVAGERARDALMVQWEKTPGGKQMLLKKVTTRNQLRFAGSDSAFKQSVALQTLDPILLSFEIKTITPDSSANVIAAEPLFLADIKELTPFGSGGILEALGVKAPKKYSFKKDRSYIDEAESFEQNIEIRSMMTYTEGGETNIYSILMHRSMVLLPKQAIQPRLADERIGHFAVNFREYDEDNPVSLNHYIKRWRLKIPEEDRDKFKDGELVEPKDKIVFYIDNSTPEKWRSYIRQGVEDWIPAFEKAGFKNAIEARTTPDDPQFHPENVRYSVIRYAASDIPNAKGPSVVDPRSGEIIESDIIIYHNVLKLLRDWRFSQTAASDPEVRTTDIPDEIIGDALRFVVAHEVGHALGLRHNMGASAAFPVDSLRSASFTQKYSTTPSIMDYARFNYVAQPEDEGVKLTPPRLGIYDKYAIKWAYRPIPSAENEYEEVDTLNKWIAEHAGDPWYHFGEGDLSGKDPTSQRESLGDDIVKASEYGVENIRYIINHFDDWLTNEGKRYNKMEDLYKATLNQYRRYLDHVGTLVAGVYLRRPRQGREQPFYRFVEKQKQEEAVQFLLSQYREIPQWLENDNLDSKLNIIDEQAEGLVRRIVTPSNYIERLYYSSLRAHLINDGKLMFLLNSEASNPKKDAYRATDLLDDIREDVFKETKNGEPLGYYRRLFQNVYVDWLLDDAHLERTTAPQQDGMQTKAAEREHPLCNFDHQYKVSQLSNRINSKRALIEEYAQEHDLYFQLMDLQRRDKRALIESMVLSEVKKVKRIIEQNSKVENDRDSAHYAYLLRRINVFLNAGL